MKLCEVQLAALIDTIFVFMCLCVYPNAVEHVTVWKHTNVEVGLNYVVELGILLVAEKCIRHPHLEMCQGYYYFLMHGEKMRVFIELQTINWFYNHLEGPH